MDFVVMMILQLAKVAMLQHWLFVLLVATTTAILCFRAYKISYAAAKHCFEKSLAYLLAMCVLHFFIHQVPASLGLALLTLYGYLFFVRILDCLCASYLSWHNPKAFEQLLSTRQKQRSDYFEPL